MYFLSPNCYILKKELLTGHFIIEIVLCLARVNTYIINSSSDISAYSCMCVDFANDLVHLLSTESHQLVITRKERSVSIFLMKTVTICYDV